MNHLLFFTWIFIFTVSCISAMLYYYFTNKHKTPFLKLQSILLSCLSLGIIVRFIIFYLHINLAYKEFPILLHLAKVLFDTIIILLLLYAGDRLFNREPPRIIKYFFHFFAVTYFILACISKLKYTPTIFHIRQIFFLIVACYALFTIFNNAKKCLDKMLKKTALLLGTISLIAFAVALFVQTLFQKEIQNFFYFLYLLFVFTWNIISITYIFLYLKKTTAKTLTNKQYKFTNREQEIIELLLRGFSNKKIGEELFISQFTVKNHIQHIAQKTGVSTKLEILSTLNKLLP